MHRILKYIFFFIIVNFQLYANSYNNLENEVLYYKRKLRTTDGIEKINAYRNLVLYYHYKEYNDSITKKYVNEAIKYSNSKNDENLLALSYTIDAQLKMININDYKTQIDYCTKALNLGIKNINHLAVQLALVNISYYFSNLLNFNSALNYLELAEKFSDNYYLDKLEVNLLKLHLTSKINNYNDIVYLNKININIDNIIEYFDNNIDKYSEIERIRFKIEMNKFLLENKMYSVINPNVIKINDIKYFNYYYINYLLSSNSNQSVFSKKYNQNSSIKYHINLLKYKNLKQNNLISEIFNDIEIKIKDELNNSIFYSEYFLSNYNIFKIYNQKTNEKLNIITLRYLINEDIKIIEKEFLKINYLDIYQESITLPNQKSNKRMYIFTIVITIIILTFFIYFTIKRNKNKTIIYFEPKSIFEEKWIDFLNNFSFEQHDDDSFSTICNTLEVSETYMRKFLKQKYNKSYPQFINEYKINYLLDYLDRNKDVKYTQEQIKTLLGYKSLNSLKLNFEKVTNQKLSTYLKNIKK
jgi:hypothetical protein